MRLARLGCRALCFFSQHVHVHVHVHVHAPLLRC